LPDPFTSIGEPGWHANALANLKAYDVPLPTPEAPEAIKTTENRLAVTFPASYTKFTTELGPLDLDGFALLAVSEVVNVGDLWCKDSFSGEDRARLSTMFRILETGGDPIVFDASSGKFCEIDHDSAAFTNWVDTFDDLILLAFLSLPVGYYGWPDPDGSLYELVSKREHELFRTRLL